MWSSSGGVAGDGIQPPTATPRHLVTLMMLLLDGSHLALPACSTLCSSSSLAVSPLLYSLGTPSAQLGKQPVSEPAAGAGRWAALQAPWTLGNSDQRVLKDGVLEAKDE